jgi:hypothetical protein
VPSEGEQVLHSGSSMALLLNLPLAAFYAAKERDGTAAHPLCRTRIG